MMNPKWIRGQIAGGEIPSQTNPTAMSESFELFEILSFTPQIDLQLEEVTIQKIDRINLSFPRVFLDRDPAARRPACPAAWMSFGTVSSAKPKSARCCRLTPWITTWWLSHPTGKYAENLGYSSQVGIADTKSFKPPTRFVHSVDWLGVGAQKVSKGY